MSTVDELSGLKLLVSGTEPRSECLCALAELFTDRAFDRVEYELEKVGLVGRVRIAGRGDNSVRTRRIDTNTR